MLETQRLYLIPFGAEDLGLLHRLFTHPFIRKYLWDDLIIDLEESEKFIKANNKYFHFYHWGLWKVICKKTLSEVGFAGLWPILEDPQPQLLYGLFPEYSGEGLATEAVKAVLDHAFNELDFSHVSASMDAWHKKSRKLAERLGLHLIKMSNIEGRLTCIYSMNAPIPHKVSNLN